MPIDTVCILILVSFFGMWTIVAGIKDGTIRELIDAYLDSFN